MITHADICLDDLELKLNLTCTEIHRNKVFDNSDIAAAISVKSNMYSSTDIKFMVTTYQEITIAYMHQCIHVTKHVQTTLKLSWPQSCQVTTCKLK